MPAARRRCGNCGCSVQCHGILISLLHRRRKVDPSRLRSEGEKCLHSGRFERVHRVLLLRPRCMQITRQLPLTIARRLYDSFLNAIGSE